MVMETVPTNIVNFGVPATIALNLRIVGLYTDMVSEAN